MLDTQILRLPVEAIAPNPYQPRTDFAPEPLAELADSIRRHGILQPLTVRRTKTGWELVAGERRLRAAKLAGLDTVPCLQIRAEDQESALLALIENSADLTADLPEIIARSLAIKARVVEQDPTEQGLRRVLNFGHTIGHAIESCAGGELLHGECVALGMLPMCAPALRHRLAGILRKCGLPTTCGFTARQLLPYLRHDKKAASGEIRIVLADEAGAFRMEKETPEEILRRWEGAET